MYSGECIPCLLHFPIVIILLALLLVAIPDLLKTREDSHLYGTDLLLWVPLRTGLYRNRRPAASHESGYAQGALVWHKMDRPGVFWTASVLYYFFDSQRSTCSSKQHRFFLCSLIVVVSGHLGKPPSSSWGIIFITGSITKK